MAITKHEIQALIKELKRPTKEAYEKFKKEAPTRMLDEVAIKHPYTDAGIHMRNDGVIETFAKDSSIILDGETSSLINIVGTTVTVGKEIIIQADKIYINGMLLNDFWYTDEELAWAMTPTSLEKAIEPTLVAGIPQQGQYNVSITNYLNPVRLFKLDKHQNFADERLMELLR